MTSSAIETLRELMTQLRHPETGCPWDAVQTFSSIAPYTIEEAYEVADAIARGDMTELRDELGDLLLQVVFHARLAEEASLFDLDDVAAGIVRKMIRRHPHVFDETGALLPAERRPTDSAAVKASWEQIKKQERAEKAENSWQETRSAGLLDGVPQALPALSRAEKISRRAASYGFDWPEAREVIAKVREELAEVEESLEQGDPATAVAEEIGDLLFSVANLARHTGTDPEEALRVGTRKFERRFAAMADHLTKDGQDLSSSDLPAMETAWQAVKRAGG